MIHPISALSQREISLEDDSFIVTKTDLQGNITYANRTFMKITGYSEPELLGQPQNLVRHPDMPKGLFRFLWQNISRQQECFAYINNKAKNGDHYWVFANISPIYDQQQQHCGYYSCRRKPSRQAISKVQPFYQRMLELERSAPHNKGQQSMAWFVQQIESEFGSYEKFILGL